MATRGGDSGASPPDLVYVISDLLHVVRTSPPVVMRALEISLLKGVLLGGGYQCVMVPLPISAWRFDELKHGVIVYGPFVAARGISFSSPLFLSGYCSSSPVLMPASFMGFSLLFFTER
ncbi:hypothetical protein Bca4012_013061 [Brassica carinata]|uniref:Uncharacterized protein n=1 Tax=Brassica carinata TaxID=52824 RepID=A0A8X7Q4I6_BRACI|nr:hypothetical protein Bca52824_069379 [Brassica carinata]